MTEWGGGRNIRSESRECAAAHGRNALLDGQPERQDAYVPALWSLDAACTTDQGGIARGVAFIHAELLKRTGKDRSHLLLLGDLVSLVESARMPSGDLVDSCPNLFAGYLTTESA